MTSKIVNFTNVPIGSLAINTNWKCEKQGQSMDSGCQTSSELYEFNEIGTQSALYEEVGTQMSKADNAADGRCIIGDFDGSRNDSSYPNNLKQFLLSKLDFVIKELEENYSSKAFDQYEVSTSDSSDEVVLWKTLSVDLEKKKVVFPDWATAKHYPGSIATCCVTRNKERLYDIDYDDGVRLTGVREEHIRWLSTADKRNGRQNQRSSSSSGANKSSDGKKTDRRAGLAARISEGMRVHAKVVFKSGVEKFVPARVTKVHRGGTYDIESEGGKTEHNVGIEDLMLGLEDGDIIEARRPNKVQLQCTAVSWNSTGSTLVSSYGREDIVGWCDFPGAVCTWNVFGKNFDPANPDFTLDHNSCIMCIKCHPSQPAVIVGGSFNGEILVWDLSLPEQLFAISPITEHGHKEPVLDVDWLYDPVAAEWMIASVSADGRVLLWSMSNKLLHPIKGALLTSKKKGASKSSKNKFQNHHGGTCISFCGASAGGTGAGLGVITSTYPKWFLVGEQGGGVIRGQILRTLGSGPRLTPEVFITLPPVEEIYSPVRKGDEAFSHESHIGSVNALSCSPFARNIFLSAGGDGCVKMFHMFESLPLRHWTPEPSPGTLGVRGTFSSISGMQFSPNKPGLFAAGSADGLLYFFDVTSSLSTPLAVLEGPVEEDPTQGPLGRKSSLPGQPGTRRSGLTAIAFNRKQRDLIAACDTSGRIHIWRLSWGLSHATPQEFEFMKAVNNNIAAAEDDVDR